MPEFKHSTYSWIKERKRFQYLKHYCLLKVKYKSPNNFNVSSLTIDSPGLAVKFALVLETLDFETLTVGLPKLSLYLCDVRIATQDSLV